MCTILNCISHLLLNIGSHDKSMPIWAVRATWALHLEGGGGGGSRSGGRPVLGGAYNLTYRYFCIVVPMLNNEHHLSRERGWGRVHALPVHWSNWNKGKYSDKKLYARICPHMHVYSFLEPWWINMSDHDVWEICFYCRHLPDMSQFCLLIDVRMGSYSNGLIS